MRQFTMKLDKKNQRPVVVLKNGLTALLDTGAYIPVWTDDEDILISFLGAELIRNNVQMSGFGGVTYGNLYQVNIDVGGILYPNMHIIANNDIDASFNFILSATMFHGLIYQIDTVNHVLNIDVPDTESIVRNLRVESRNGQQFVLCNGIKTK